MLNSFTSLLVGAMLLLPAPLPAEPVAVRFIEGSIHGFLVLRTMEDKILASGDLIEVVRGDRVTSHLVFRFKDGSLDDETAVFTQRGVFRLLSDHHIQRGPAFPHPMDMLIDASTGQVTVHFTDKGQEKVEKDHLDLPPDLANGIIQNIMINIRPETPETKISYLAATPKPRLVKLSIAPQGEETFSIAGSREKATRFLVKVEVGGIAGIVAPLLNKTPDINIWVADGEVPAFVKAEEPLYSDGPVWRVEMTSPVWPQAPNSGQ